MNDDLYREICRCPEDDTLRFAYADWLDENGDPDRAEFVRVQCKIAAWGCVFENGWDHKCGTDTNGYWNCNIRLRVNELLDAHPEWSRCPCEKCGRDGACHIWISDVLCGTCRGTGDLFFMPRTDFRARTPDEWGRDLAGTLDPRTVTFARGFPDSVSCTLSEAFTVGVPTPWACEVVRRTPVTRFVLTDRTPERSSAFGGWFRWYTGSERNEISDELYHELEGEHPEDRYGPSKQPYWRTSAAAVDALALAAGRLVRRHVYGEVTA